MPAATPWGNCSSMALCPWHTELGVGGEGAALLRIRVEAVQPLTALAAIPDCLDGRHQPDGSAFDIAAARLRVQALQAQPQKAGERPI